jgi:hypothetical protein
MKYIAKPTEIVGTIELFVTEVVTDITNTEVQILRSVGTYSLDQLLSEKSSYQCIMSDLDEKILAITSLDT